MEEIEKRDEVQNNQPDTDTSVDYISAINEIKANSVSKEDYLKLREENQRLLKAFVNGETPGSAQHVEKPDINALRAELFGNSKKDLSNLEFVDKALELRQAVIDDGGLDPFVANSRLVHPTDEDFTRAEKVANILQECVDYADGNAGVFTDELKRRIN